ncbi:SPOR domain-containing protein [Bradyrhizobium sp. BRP22]|uniref:SPOR domain-containing protein n=1 Tax=Bradyrhizobium sp. BRP22 TaxID=2793821 RepID=UPI001CD5685B|nr:SPOR domain-containing protein [Bradyrhizobium sp. BRP22]MCA1457980.1 SPOR domain-containing protein [Bradyrhizobium sp. BRP22]
MADRYQDRLFPADHDYDRGANAAGRAESDPLAELARLIGQTDPFAATPPKPQPTPHPLQSRANVRPQSYQAQPEDEEVDLPAGPPPWMQRTRREAAPAQQYAAPAQDYEEPDLQPSAVHPLHRYGAQHAGAPAQEYHEELPLEEPAPEPDPSRYDDALYGRIESGEQDFQREAAYPDDPYAYQSTGYEEEEPPPRRRSSGLMTVGAVLALAVVGTGAAFAYRTYVGSPRSGEPPIIKADNSPTKIMPAQPDGAGKAPDRMVPGNGTEKLVSREETPVDVTSNSGPRVVFPPLNQNANPPPVSSVAPSAASPMTTSGTLPNNEPRRIRTYSVKGDATEAGVPASAPPPPAKSAPATRSASANPQHGNPASANASANTPLSLAPGAPQPDPAPTRLASTNPTATVSSGGGYVVQVSSQRNEADAQASYRALQGKYPSVLGSQSLVVKRVDLGEKGVYYRAFAGPFSSLDQATQVCSSLKAAGGPQCLIQRN